MAKKNGMSREEAGQLYENLHASMKNWMANKGQQNKSSQKIDPKKIAETIRQGLKGNTSSIGNIGASNAYARNDARLQGGVGAMLPPIKTMDRGQALALILIMFFAVAKVFFSAMEAVGVGSVKEAMASTSSLNQVSSSPIENFSQEDKKVLTSLDARRTELAERGKKMDLREIDLNARESELEVQLAELRELTSKLKVQREGVDQKHNAQVEQLAKIYSAMDPEESAKLISEIDTKIAVEIMGKMSEKRIGQILALMDKERALSLSKLIFFKS